MLTSFEAENYRSIRRIRLDFTNVKNYRFNTECLKGDILDKIVIMGGNGVGKTNFAWAILDIASTLHGGGNIGHMNEGSFLNCYAEGGETSFAYTFNFNGSSVKYRYSKSSPTRLTREEMRVDRRTVFEADNVNGECILDPRYSIDVTCDGSVPVLRQLSEGMCLGGDDPVQRLLEFSSQMLYFKSAGQWCDHHIGLSKGEPDMEKYLTESGSVDSLRSFLSEITDVSYDMTAEDGRVYMMKNGRRFPLIDTASRGTLMLIRLFCWYSQTKDEGSLMVFDDFDCMFHYETAEKALRLIVSGTKAQCIFITHHGRLFSNEIMRPDCCFIMTEDSLDPISSLTDIRLRKGHNIEKLLKDGEFSNRARWDPSRTGSVFRVLDPLLSN